MNKMKILYMANIPSPYRVKYFNELGKSCDLTVLFERKGYATRDESWLKYSFDTFRGIVLNGINLGTFEKLCFGFVKYFKNYSFDYIVITNMASVTGILAIYWLKRHNIPYCIEGDGGFAGNGRSIKEWLKKYMISSAKMCFSTSKLHDEYYLRYGAECDQIFRYPFTSLSRKDMLDAPLERSEKNQIKQQLKITEQRIILSIGSFIPRKGMDILIRAAAGLDKNWGIYIIGGQPTDEYIAMKDEMQMTNLHFVEFIEPERLKLYYQSADLFVLATREDIWGLVINEAMSYALPVITTNKCVAGMELVRNKHNGLIVESENVESLREALLSFVETEELLDACSQGALDTIKKYTIEDMVESHLRIFHEDMRGER